VWGRTRVQYRPGEGVGENNNIGRRDGPIVAKHKGEKDIFYNHRQKAKNTYQDSQPYILHFLMQDFGVEGEKH